MKMETVIIVIEDVDGSRHLKKNQRVLDNSFESLVYITRLFLFGMIKFIGHNNKSKISKWFMWFMVCGLKSAYKSRKCLQKCLQESAYKLQAL